MIHFLCRSTNTHLLKPLLPMLLLSPHQIQHSFLLQYTPNILGVEDKQQWNKDGALRHAAAHSRPARHSSCQSHTMMSAIEISSKPHKFGSPHTIFLHLSQECEMVNHVKSFTEIQQNSTYEVIIIECLPPLLS